MVERTRRIAAYGKHEVLRADFNVVEPLVQLPLSKVSPTQKMRCAQYQVYVDRKVLRAVGSVIVKVGAHPLPEREWKTYLGICLVNWEWTLLTWWLYRINSWSRSISLKRSP